MLNNIFSSVISGDITAPVYLLCTAVSLILGAVAAFCTAYKSRQSRSFTLALVLLPAIVQTVILLVNGNIGAGVAVAGAFSLVRFRSAPGSAREIAAIFLCMAIGLATGMGFLAMAAILTVIICAVMTLFTVVGVAEGKPAQRDLKITIPEDLDYTEIFDDMFDKYLKSHTLNKVKTTGLGSLYQLSYLIELKEESKEKEFLDKIRCLNGNLEIVSGRVTEKEYEL